jgi:small GTP-binding protein
MKCVLPCSYDLFTKILLVGNPGVGKSSILYQLTNHAFDPNPNTTIGVEFAAVYFQSNENSARIIEGDIDPATIKAQIWDCAGQTRFQTIVNSYFRQANIVIFVYDICNPQSFYDLDNWNTRAQSALRDKPYVTCVIGNKSDIKEDITAVAKSVGKEFADSINALFFETSARNTEDTEDTTTSITIDEIFCKCIEEAYRRYNNGETMIVHNSIDPNNPNKVQLSQLSQLLSAENDTSSCMRCL